MEPRASSVTMMAVAEPGLSLVVRLRLLFFLPGQKLTSTSFVAFSESPDLLDRARNSSRMATFSASTAFDPFCPDEGVVRVDQSSETRVGIS